MKIIALSGWKGSGKDTIADFLVKEDNYIKLSFAESLKDLVAEQYNFPREWCDDRNKKETPLKRYPVVTTDKFVETIHTLLQKELSSGYWTPRALCILEGSVKRSVNNAFWTQRVIDHITQFNNYKTELYVISDLRYKNEANQLKEVFGDKVELVRINRFKESFTNDPSERDLDDYDKFDNVLNVHDLSIAEVQGLVEMIYIGKYT